MQSNTMVQSRVGPAYHRTPWFQLRNFFRLGYDVYHEPDQSKVAEDLVDGLLKSATGKDSDGNPLLLPKDLSVYSGKRRADAKATNPQYTTSLAHRLFGSSKWVIYHWCVLVGRQSDGFGT